MIQIIGKTLTAHRLASAEKWDQLFIDGTSRRQIALQNLKTITVSVKLDLQDCHFIP